MWSILQGQQVECSQKNTVYPPGMGIKSSVKFINPSKTPEPTPAPIPKGKGKATKTPSTRRRAMGSRSWTRPGRRMEHRPPQKILRSRGSLLQDDQKQVWKRTRQPIHGPPPKQQTCRPGGFGKRYTPRLGQQNKPTKGTAMPIQVIISEINRTCSTLNIQANSAKWTEFLNLSIYFTHNSVNAQIEKARSTILGVVCRGHTDPNTSFHKAIKWLRIVIHNVPKRKWVADTSRIRDKDTGAPHGSFVPVTKGDLEAELRSAHTLLADTTFMEGPDWTHRPGLTAYHLSSVLFHTSQIHPHSHLRSLSLYPSQEHHLKNTLIALHIPFNTPHPHQPWENPSHPHTPPPKKTLGILFEC